MLGDNPDKPKNPLKQALRRRNGKTVQFAAPTYFEASDVDYSTEEEEEGEGEYSAQADGNDSQDQEQQADRNEAIDSNKGKQEREVNSVHDSHGSVDSRDNDGGQITLVNSERTSDDTLERSDEGSARSRKGTVRNTDSFFKDDSVETRKINLTPSLLRDDDSSGSTIKSADTKELKTRVSLDSLEKAQSPPEKAKEDKKRKEKKGMLSGLFKRKDKKHRGQEDDTEDYEKLSEELLRDSSQPKDSSESLSHEAQAPKSASQQPQRQSSKLQKTPPAKHVSGKLPPRAEQKGALVEQSTDGPPSDGTPPAFESPVLAPPVQPETTRPSNDLAAQRIVSPEIPPDELIESTKDIRQESRAAEETFESPRDARQETRVRDGTSESPKGTRQYMSTPLRDGTSESPKGTRHELHTPSMDMSYESKPENLKIPKQRMPLDEFDSSPDTAEPPNLLAKEDQGLVETEAPKERLSESPVQVDLPDRLRTQNTPKLVVDTSSQEDPSASPVSPTSSPEIIEAPRYNDREETPASTTQSPSITPTWSDASLRAYLEDDGEIRDLLVVVHDKSNVKPADPDHPVVKNLFQEENRTLGEISNQLDGLLGDWLARKSKLAAR
ncbi:hypothetical protein MMC07_001157 [Pseudocyphellaria aurata]|nr:hypothetical protein [Pseudocyphellaria aurata]